MRLSHSPIARPTLLSTAISETATLKETEVSQIEDPVPSPYSRDLDVGEGKARVASAQQLT